MSQLPTESNLTATISATPSPDNSPRGGYTTSNDVDNSEVNNASLEKLKKLEEELKESLKKLFSDQHPLYKKVGEDSDFVKSVGVDALKKNRNPKAPPQLPGGYRDLDDFQAKSKQTFEEGLKDVQDAQQKENILKQLSEVHKMRANLLEKATREEDNEVMSKAYRALMGRLGGKGGVTAYDPDKPAKSEFIKDISGRNPPTMTHSDPNINYQVHYDGDTLTATDPETLGIATAAAGYKKVEFSGAPWEALNAAKAALEHGVLSVGFDKSTVKNILNPYAYHSWAEYKQAFQLYKSLMDISKANTSARNHKINNVFNESSLSDQAKTFSQIPPNSPARSQFVKGLTPEEQAALAVELRNQSFHNGTKSINGSDYIQDLARTNVSDKTPPPVKQEERRREANLSRLVAEKTVQATYHELNAMKKPEEVVNFIRQQKSTDMKNAYYQIIDKLTPYEDPVRNKEFQNQVRVQLLVSMITHVSSNQVDDKGNANVNPPKLNQEALVNILANTTIEDRAEIMKDLRNVDFGKFATDNKLSTERTNSYNNIVPRCINIIDSMVQQADKATKPSTTVQQPEQDPPESGLTVNVK